MEFWKVFNRGIRVALIRVPCCPLLMIDQRPSADEPRPKDRISLDMDPRELSSKLGEGGGWEADSAMPLVPIYKN